MRVLGDWGMICIFASLMYYDTDPRPRTPATLPKLDGAERWTKFVFLAIAEPHIRLPIMTALTNRSAR
jgi:hypothetical protein